MLTQQLARQGTALLLPKDDIPAVLLGKVEQLLSK
jgi:hypothetical protein